jgi:hypothetical protein
MLLKAQRSKRHFDCHANKLKIMAADVASEHGSLSQETLSLGDPLFSQDDLRLSQDDLRLSQDDPMAATQVDQDSHMPATQVDQLLGGQVPDNGSQMPGEPNKDTQDDLIELASLGDDNLEEDIVRNMRDMLFVMQGWKFEGKYMQEAGQKCDSLLLQASTLLSQFEFEMAGNKGFNRADAEKQYEEIGNEFASIKRFYMLATDDVIGTPERTKPSC